MIVFKHLTNSTCIQELAPIISNLINFFFVICWVYYCTKRVWFTHYSKYRVIDTCCCLVFFFFVVQNFAIQQSIRCGCRCAIQLHDCLFFCFSICQSIVKVKNDFDRDFVKNKFWDTNVIYYRYHNATKSHQ